MLRPVRESIRRVSLPFCIESAKARVLRRAASGQHGARHMYHQRMQGFEFWDLKIKVLWVRGCKGQSIVKLMNHPPYVALRRAGLIGSCRCRAKRPRVHGFSFQSRTVASLSLRHLGDETCPCTVLLGFGMVGCTALMILGKADSVSQCPRFEVHAIFTDMA